MLKYNARGTDAPWYQARDLTEAQRAVFRANTLASQKAKRKALSGEYDGPRHPINVPHLNPAGLMPATRRNGLRALSLFSGGGGMDIGFDRAGFEHVASYELMAEAAAVIQQAQSSWRVFGGVSGDVNRVNWSSYRDRVDVLHGGPPCQPFSHAGRRNGQEDARNMIPALVKAIMDVQPAVFVCENVAGLIARRFEGYVQTSIIAPLRDRYSIRSFCLDAADFGVPQKRRRVFFVGFRHPEAARAFQPPAPTHNWECFGGPSSEGSLPHTMGAREALGLPPIGTDALAPTIRSGLTGPRHTTSILNSVTAQRIWGDLQIWPNGVAASRTQASAYIAKNGHFRLSIADCMVLQGFPHDWPIGTPVYFALGLIGNSVAPPMSYRLARAIAAALKKANV